MLQTKQLILACLVLALGLAVGFVLMQIFKVQNYPIAAPWEPGERPMLSDAAVTELQGLIQTHLTAKTGQPIIGLEPQLLLTEFPALLAADFNGVEAVVGNYAVLDGAVQYSEENIQDEAVDDISSTGLKTLFTNYMRRNKLPLTTPPTEVMATLKVVATSSPDQPKESEDDFMACTMDAMLCPDGSYVGRSLPGCAFRCPGEPTTSPADIVCTQEQKDNDVCIEIYAPVCAQVQVECVTAPCNPVPQTFPNSCFACSEDRVISYVDGSCEGGDLTTE
jgi:hypothetical protein